jgi:uncharacterized membrane protein YhaH (DUF805 family)
MDIYFKDGSGSRVGFVIGTDIKDNSGSRVGYIEGGNIKDNNGNRVGYIEGGNFKDNYGARVGYIEGDNIKDTYGARVGYPESSASDIEMCAAGLLLFGLEAEARQAASTRQAPLRPETGWEWFLFILSYFLKPFYELSYLNKYTATRGNYWRTLFCTYVYYLVGGMIITQSVKSTVAFIVIILILSLPLIFVSIRRMHDLGKSGWWNLIPIAGFFMCAFLPGKVENNPYV